MTAITKRRGWWQTAATSFERGAHRSIVVGVTPHGLLIRLKGQRSERLVPWGNLYLLACRMEAAARSLEKARKVKEKKRGKV